MYRADTGGTPEHTQVVTPECFPPARTAGLQSSFGHGANQEVLPKPAFQAHGLNQEKRKELGELRGTLIPVRLVPAIGSTLARGPSISYAAFVQL